MATIPISELNNLLTLEKNDLLVVVDSGSMTTYHTPVYSFMDWMWVSGSASYSATSISSSNSISSSLADMSRSASYSFSGSYAVTTSIALNYLGILNFVPFSTSGSWASQSISASHCISASYALNTPEYLYWTTMSISSSIASSSISSSWAITASYPTTYAEYSVTTSYTLVAPPLSAKAWMYFSGDPSPINCSNAYTQPETSSVNYNFRSMSFLGSRHVRNINYNKGDPGGNPTICPYIDTATVFAYRLFFKDNLPDVNYSVMGFFYENEGTGGQSGHLGVIVEDMWRMYGNPKNVASVDVVAVFGQEVPSVAHHPFTAAVVIV